MYRYQIIFSYNGSEFNGYQKQVDKQTVQGHLETMLTKLNNNTFTSLISSGRTDSKVHANNASAHFDLNNNIPIDKIKQALNSSHPYIYIKQIVPVASTFHARFDVSKKEYVYLMNLGMYDPINKDYIYQFNKPLNIKQMKKACRFLLGEHNFKSFTKSTPNISNYNRTIYKCSITKQGEILKFQFIGNGFMRYMVRNLVGTLIHIGENKIKPKDVIKILQLQDRTSAHKTANPEGLYLNKVYYK